MSTDREQLIEEAAKASARARRGVTAKVNESDRRATEAALTVFEKALGEATTTPSLTVSDAHSSSVSVSEAHTPTEDYPDAEGLATLRSAKENGWTGEKLMAALDGKTPTDDEREALRDELAHWPIGSGYYQTSIGSDEAAEIADMILAAGFRRAVQGEPEWEYGIRPLDDEVPLSVSPMPTYEAARVRADNIRGGWAIVRRAKAGPWVPVQAPEDEGNL